MLRAATGLMRAALDVLYPPTCVFCETGGEWLCRDCLSHIRLMRKGQRGQPGLACTLSVGFYADPVLRNLLARLKYDGAYCLMPALEELLMRWRDAFQEPWAWAGANRLIVTAIPGDEGRLRKRGCDHVALLADAVWRRLIPWAERRMILARTASRGPNADLPAHAARQANVRGMFCALNRIEGRVLLVDDVMTTGATAVEAARVLQEAGASQVYLLTLAKGAADA